MAIVDNPTKDSVRLEFVERRIRQVFDRLTRLESVVLDAERGLECRMVRVESGAGTIESRMLLAEDGLLHLATIVASSVSPPKRGTASAYIPGQTIEPGQTVEVQVDVAQSFRDQLLEIWRPFSGIDLGEARDASFDGVRDVQVDAETLVAWSDATKRLLQQLGMHLDEDAGNYVFSTEVTP